MNTNRTPTTAPRRGHRPWHPILIGLALAAAFGLGACQAGATSIPTSPIVVPTFPPDDMASGSTACLDAPTMAIVDQLRATGADVPGLLAANKDALVAGLGDLQSADPATMTWKVALINALQSGNADAAAAQVAVLAAGDITITPC